MDDLGQKQLNNVGQQLKDPIDYVSQEIISDLISKAYPIGSIYINVNGIVPNISLGFGVWSAFGSGKVLVGIDTTDADFDTAEKTGGEKTHTLTTTEMPSHSHTVNVGNTGIGALSLTVSGQNSNFQAGAVGSTGGDVAHNNVQPYIVVYMWKRTA